jgi:hypothetical protein
MCLKFQLGEHRPPGHRRNRDMKHVIPEREADLPAVFPVKSSAWLALPAHPFPIAAFASRKDAFSGARTLRFEFDPNRQRRSDCKGIATKAFSAPSLRFAGRPLDSLKSGRVLVPPPRESPNQGQAYEARNIVPPL